MGVSRFGICEKIAVLGLCIRVNGDGVAAGLYGCRIVAEQCTNRSIGTYAVLFLMIGAEPSENGALIPAMPSTAV